MQNLQTQVLSLRSRGREGINKRFLQVLALLSTTYQRHYYVSRVRWGKTRERTACQEMIVTIIRSKSWGCRELGWSPCSVFDGAVGEGLPERGTCLIPSEIQAHPSSAVHGHGDFAPLLQGTPCCYGRLQIGNWQLSLAQKIPSGLLSSWYTGALRSPGTCSATPHHEACSGE